jgi:tRNA dimethylallyltransferase
LRNFIFVVGATASGKSEWAVEQAQKNKGVIFNCDSIQLYKEVVIGAAKPSDEEKNRVPHFLFDLISPPQEMTASQYRERFLEELKSIKVSTPIYVVGGTGFYFLALEKGLYEISATDLDLKEKIELEAQAPNGFGNLLEEVKRIDPEYALKLHLNDHYRIIRAVEIIRSNPGKTISELKSEKEQSVGLEGNIKKVGIRWEPSALEKRIRIRTNFMMRQGLVKEVEDLLSRGLENWAPLKSVGYLQVVQYLKGEIAFDDLEEQIIIATRQLAKKQRTWFQRDSAIQWVERKPE